MTHSTERRARTSAPTARRAMAVAAASAVLSAAAARAVNSPVAVSGWNQDLVAETTASSSVTSAFDLGGAFAFYANPVNGASGGGLPASGSFTSASNSATTFQFQPYNASNALLFNGGAAVGGTGTLALSAPSAYSSLAFLATAANGASTLTYGLRFSDGSTTTNTMVVGDWFNTTPYAITDLGRAVVSTPTLSGFNGYPGNPRMYETDVTLNAADAGKTLVGVTFAQSAGAQAAVFAVSGSVASTVNQLVWSGATNGSWDTATANWQGGGKYASTATVRFDDTATGTTAVTVAAAGVAPTAVIFANGTKAYTVAGGPIAGTAPLIVGGTGTVTLAAANTYVGTTTVTGGTLVIGPAGSIASPAVVVSAGGTMNVSAGGVGGAAAGYTLSVDGTANLATAATTVTALTGGGTVNLAGTALTVGTGTTFAGTVAGTGTLAVGNGANLTVTGGGGLRLPAGVTVGAGVAGSTAVVTTADNFGTAGVGTPVTLAGGTLSGASGTAASWGGSVALGAGGGTLTGGNNGTLNVNGVVSGTGPLTVSTAGTAVTVLNAANTYTGNTTVAANGTSTLQIGRANAIGTAGGLVLSGSGTPVVDLNGYAQAVAYLAGTSAAATVTNSGLNTSTLTISNGNTAAGTAATSAAVITQGDHPVALLKAGTGNQILAGASSYTGGTTVAGGTLSVANPAALGLGTVRLTGGTLSLGGPVIPGSNGSLSGFAGFTLNTGGGSGGPTLSADNATLTLTDNRGGEANTAFTPTPVTIPAAGFTASFTYANTGGADGIAFVVQNDARGTAAVGGAGGGLGYGGINNSGAVEFNVYSGNPIGTSFGSNGSVPTFTTVSPVNLANATTNVAVTYNGSGHTLTEVLTQGTASKTVTFTGVNFTTLLGGSTGYVGFAGGTGGVASTQTVTNFSANLTTGPTYSSATSVANAVTAASNTSSTLLVDVTATSNAAAVGPLTVEAGATLTLAAVGPAGVNAVLTVPSLSILGSNGSAGQLNVGSNSVVVQSGGATALAAAAAASVGTAGGLGGLTSSAAQADPTHLTTLAVTANNDGAGHRLYGAGTDLGLFDGVADPTYNAGLIRYTYFGDANLDGTVDGQDYTRIDAGYARGLTGWANGDFNYDGAIDGSDYTLIDNTFNMQPRTEPSRAATAGLVASSTAELAAVPEPALTMAVTVLSVGIAATRRRRVVGAVSA